MGLNPESVRLILLGQVAETNKKLLIAVGYEPKSDDGSNKPESDVIYALRAIKIISILSKSKFFLEKIITVKPELTTTSEQRPPVNNGHYFWVPKVVE